MIPTIHPGKLLQALGLSPRDVELAQLLGGEAAPAKGPQLSARDCFASAAHLFEVGVPPAQAWPGARLLASADHPGLFLLECAAPLLELTGAVERLSERSWTFDARESPACAAFADGHVLLALPSGLMVGRTAERSEEPKPFAAWLEQRLTPPWLEERRIPDWLLQTATDKWNESGAYSRAVAAGLIARFWEPDSAAMAAVADVLAGRGPVVAVQRWFAALPANAREAADGQACNESERLRAELPKLERIASQPRPGLHRALRRWISGRDDLESYAFLLGDERADSDVELELRRLDRAAQSCFSVFSRFDAASDPRLRRVARLEPELWWGRLAGP